jgi:sec-independent protein translocase protein TatA
MYPTSVLLRKEHRIRVALAGADASLFERYRQVRQRELALTPDGIALLVFGPKKLPELGKGIGKGIRGFKSAMKEQETSDSTTTNTLPTSKA